MGGVRWFEGDGWMSECENGKNEGFVCCVAEKDERTGMD